MYELSLEIVVFFTNSCFKCHTKSEYHFQPLFKYFIQKKRHIYIYHHEMCTFAEIEKTLSMLLCQMGINLNFDLKLLIFR